MNGRAEMKSKNLAWNEITCDRTFNVRTRYEGIAELRQDIDANGLLVPLMVTPVKGGKYAVVAGFRRHAALSQEPTPATVPCSIVEGNPEELFRINGGENLSRLEITSYERAMIAQRFNTDFGLSAADIACKYPGAKGWSKGYVGNLLRCLKDLRPEIIEAWKAGVPALSTDWLTATAALTPDEQAEVWKKKIGTPDAVPNADMPNDNPKGEAVKAPKKIGADDLRAALAALRNNPKIGESARDGAEAVFLFALGEADTFKIVQTTVYDPEKGREAAKKEKALAAARKILADAGEV